MNTEQRTEREQRVYEKTQQLRMIDDNFMTVIFNDPECCELLLNTILDRTDIDVISSKSQYQLKNLGGRSVTLDIFATDGEGKKYNIEIQRKDAYAVPRRARYHSSLIDAEITLPGDDFSQLAENYVIFITENDIMKKGKPIYTVERVVEETGEKFNDGSHIIYVNSTIQDDTALGRLMADFYRTSASEISYKLLAERVGYYKNNEEGNRIMCKIIEDLVNEERKDERIETALRMIADGEVDVEKISRYTNLSPAEVKVLIEKHSA